MSTDDTSGNRWEPSQTSSGVNRPPERPTDDAPTDAVASPPLAGEPIPVRRGWLAAGAAAVVFLVGGAGGFMVGHATAGATQEADPFGQQGPRNGFGPGGNGQVPGQAPGLPPRSDDRHDQDSGPDGSHT
jgi:hypothetical protein